jgi:hypothetical protein
MSADVQNSAETPADGKPRRGRPPKDWGEAKHLYVHGMIDADGTHEWPTLMEVGRRYDLASVERRAAAEKWADERELYRQKLAQARQEKRVDLLAAKAAEFDSKALQAFDALITQVRAHLALSAQAKKPLHPQTLARLATTARLAHVSGRLAMGDTTEISKQIGTVTHEFDLSNLNDDELAQLEQLRSKMQGVPLLPPQVH